MNSPTFGSQVGVITEPCAPRLNVECTAATDLRQLTASNLVQNLATPSNGKPQARWCARLERSGNENVRATLLGVPRMGRDL